MTIVVGAASPDGLVLAGDRRTTFADEKRHRIWSDHAQKVFAVGDMGVATYGHAFIGTRTIAGLMDQFIAQLDESKGAKIDTFATTLGKYFDEQFQAALEEQETEWDTNEDGYPLGFLVAGYGEEGVGRIHEVLVPGAVNGEADATTTAGGFLWRGQTDVIVRLWKGIDLQGLGEAGVKLDDLPDDLSKALAGLEYNGLPTVTMQDAVDLASFVVRTTVDAQRFSDGTVASPEGVPGCGGEPLILAIEQQGPKWVSGPGLTRPSRAGWAEGAHPDNR